MTRVRRHTNAAFQFAAGAKSALEECRIRQALSSSEHELFRRNAVVDCALDTAGNEMPVSQPPLLRIQINFKTRKKMGKETPWQSRPSGNMIRSSVHPFTRRPMHQQSYNSPIHSLWFAIYTTLYFTCTLSEL